MRCCVQWEAEKKEKCFLLLGSNVRGNGLPLIVDELLWMSLFLNGYTLVSGSEGGFMNRLDIESCALDSRCVYHECSAGSLFVSSLKRSNASKIKVTVHRR